MRRLLLVLCLLLPAAAGAGELEGKLLVASRKMPANFFSEALILVCRHDAEGAFGLIVNRRAGQAEAGTGAIPLHMGGPVSSHLLFLLMPAEGAPDDALKVEGGFAVGNPTPYLSGERPAPPKALLAIGYTGWTAGQLEDEIRQGAWLVELPDDGLVFGGQDDAKWDRAVKRGGTGL